MSARRPRPYSLLDLLVTLGFTLGVTAAALGVLVAVTHTGRRDGVVAQLEGDAEFLLNAMGRDFGFVGATPGTRLHTYDDGIAIEADFGGTDVTGEKKGALTPALVTGVVAAENGVSSTILLDRGPGGCGGSDLGCAKLSRKEVAVVDERSRRMLTVDFEIENEAHARVLGEMPAEVHAGAWLLSLDVVRWRHANASDVTKTCLANTPCALFRNRSPVVDSAALERNAEEIWSQSVDDWQKVVDGVRGFVVKKINDDTHVEVMLELERSARGRAPFRFQTRRTFALKRGRR